MKERPEKHKILILGGSGFVGNSLYRELLPYFEVHGSYCTQEGSFFDNQVFHHFCTENDSIAPLLCQLRPSVIISALKGNFKSQYNTHSEIVQYVKENSFCHLIFLSSPAVFDAKPFHPAYENDPPLSETDLGKFKISVEKMLMETIPLQSTIVRLPLILGINSPTIFHLRQCIRHRATFDVYPNLVISATTINKLCQQIHYIINHALIGILHLTSNDMVHHEDLFREITSKISDKMPIFKSVFSSNEIRYSAILPKENILPKTYQITIAQVIEESSLKEEITSIT